MVEYAQIRCVTKSGRDIPWERFSYIGGVNMDGSEWKVTQDWIVEGIETGAWNFTVAVDGRRVPVMVVESSTGHKYIKTETDGEQPDSLLCLPEFPWHWRYSKHER